MYKFIIRNTFVITLGIILNVFVLPYDHANSMVPGPECVLIPQGTVGGGDANYVGDVSSIMHANCDPYATLEDDEFSNHPDGTPKEPHEYSCEGNQNEAGNRICLDTTFPGCGGAAQYEIRVNYKGLLPINDNDNIRLTINDHDHATGEPIGVGASRVYTDIDGDMLCVMADLAIGGSAGNVCGVAINTAVADPDDRQDDSGFTIFSGSISSSGLNNPLYPSLPYNCLPVPTPPRPVLNLDWGGIISPICTNYDSSSSLFKYYENDIVPDLADAGNRNRSFIGVVMECIEDSMNNMFTQPVLDGGTVTLYESFVLEMRPIIYALLVLYVMVFGYPYVYGKRGLGHDEWHWFLMRFALVVFFTMTTAIGDYIVYLQITSKNLSAVVMEAASGDLATAETARGNLATAAAALAVENNDLIQARRNLAANPTDAGLQAAEAAALAARDAEIENYTAIRILSESYGYRYCDFRSLVDNTSLTYPPGKEYMRLWDMIDCKLSKILGIGDNIKAPRSPHLLLLTIASIFTNIGIGFVNFILAVMVTIFIILVTLRVVHVYLMASIGLILLCFIGPLIIPSVLFKFTRNIFDAWLSQLIAYMVQPILLFGFLGFMFAGMDLAMYEGNHHFTPMTGSDFDNRVCMKYKGSGLSSADVICDTTADTNGSFSFDEVFYNDRVSVSQLACDDDNAMGCVIQKVAIKKERSNHMGLGLNNYFSTISYKDAKNLFIGLMQMVLICYLAHAALGLIETLSVRLTNAAGGGAVGRSRMPIVAPHKIGKAAAKPFGAVAGAAVGRPITRQLEKRARRRMLNRDARLKEAKVDGADAAKDILKGGRDGIKG